MKNLLPVFLQKLRTYPFKKTKVNSKGWDEYLLARDLFIKDNKNAEALPLLDDAVSNGIEHAYIERAFCLQELGYHYEAIDDFTKAIEFFEKDANLYYGRGHSRMILTEYDESIADLKMAIEHSFADTNLNDAYNEDMVKKGWGSVKEFYEFQLQTVAERKESCHDPEMEKLYRQMAKDVKRRTIINTTVEK